MTEASQNIHLEALRNGDSSVLESIYRSNRASFLSFALGFGINHDDALDIYQDTIIAFRENVTSGKLTELKCAPSTYLCAIGKYKIFQLLRRQKPNALNGRIIVEETNEVIDVNLFEEEYTNRMKLIGDQLKKLGNRCRKILILFYYEGYTLDEIAMKLDYSNKLVLKSQKSRCLKQLKDSILS